jgi:uncharacterized membrane protein YvbJ
VALDMDTCTDCGAGFLPADSLPNLSLPGVGNIRHLDGPAKAMLVIGGVLVVTMLFVLLAFVFGSVF